MNIKRIGALTAAGVLAACVSGCDAESAPVGGLSGRLSGQEVEVAGVWSGDEQEAFEAVLSQFAQDTGASVTYTSSGDDLPTVLQTRVDGQAPPDVAILPQPGLIAQFAKAGAAKPLAASVVAEVDAHYARIWKTLGTVDATPYAIFFKAANKSTVWYNDALFAEAAVEPPTTVEEFDTVAATLSDNGIPPMSVGGADGWVLTDWFENIYLRTAGPDMYDKLSRHEVPWTDPSVRDALTVLRDMLTEQTVAGGATGALQTDFPTSVSQVFADPPKAAMVYEGDFVAGVISASTDAEPGVEAKVFPFPSVGDRSGVVTGGDAAVAFADDEATTELMKYLASPEAAAVWAERGGFLSANKDVPVDSYPDELTREIADQIVEAGEDVRFDMSDLAPAAFGATKGAGSWKHLQDFLADPSDIDAAMAALEADAAKAWS